MSPKKNHYHSGIEEIDIPKIDMDISSLSHLEIESMISLGLQKKPDLSKNKIEVVYDCLFDNMRTGHVAYEFGHKEKEIFILRFFPFDKVRNRSNLKNHSFLPLYFRKSLVYLIDECEITEKYKIKIDPLSTNPRMDGTLNRMGINIRNKMPIDHFLRIMNKKAINKGYSDILEGNI